MEHTLIKDESTKYLITKFLFSEATNTNLWNKLARTAGQRTLHRAAARVDGVPKCAACLFAKQNRRTTPGRTSRAVRDREGILAADQLTPGQRILVDHFVWLTISSVRLKADYLLQQVDHILIKCIAVDASL